MQIRMAFDIWFDDGDLSIYEIGFPRLKSHGMTATVAIVTGYVGKNYPLYRRQPCPFVDIEQLKELIEEGWEIASHSVTHRSFLELSPDEVLAELVDSKRWIEENLGVTPRKFAFPMDLATPEQIELAKEHYEYVRPIPPVGVDAIFHRFTIEGGYLKYYSGLHKISPELERTLLPEFTQPRTGASNPGEDQSQIHADAKWAFLTGCNNSGTTLVDYLLGLHPEIDPLKCEGHQIRGNMKTPYPRNYLMPSPAVIRRPDGKRLNRVWTENLEVFRKPVVELPFLKHALMSVRATESGIWTLEKSQLTMVRMPWTQRQFSNSRFIVIVRNGYCVAEGTRRRFNRYLGSPGWEDVEPMTVARAAKHWNKAHEIMLEDLEDVKDYAVFRYEDLCRDPADMLARILEFLDLPPFDYSETLSKPIPIFMKHRPEHVVKIRNMNAESFSRLTKGEIAEITREARPMLERFGYLPVRQGHCSRCGKCCNQNFLGSTTTIPTVREDGSCTYYYHGEEVGGCLKQVTVSGKPLVCQLFPMVPSDIALIPECTYSFRYNLF